MDQISSFRFLCMTVLVAVAMASSFSDQHYVASRAKIDDVALSDIQTFCKVTQKLLLSPDSQLENIYHALSASHGLIFIEFPLHDNIPEKTLITRLIYVRGFFFRRTVSNYFGSRCFQIDSRGLHV